MSADQAGLVGDQAVTSPILTAAEAAAYLRLGEFGYEHPERSVVRFARKGKLGHVCLRGGMGFTREQLDAFIASRSTGTGINRKRVYRRRAAV